MRPKAITIEVNEDLTRVSDQRLMLLWHLSQANPAPYDDGAAGELTEDVGREIIRRWLRQTPPELWNHQGRSYYWSHLTKFAKYKPGDPDFDEGTWVAREPEPAQPGVDNVSWACTACGLTYVGRRRPDDRCDWCRPGPAARCKEPGCVYARGYDCGDGCPQRAVLDQPAAADGPQAGDAG